MVGKNSKNGTHIFLTKLSDQKEELWLSSPGGLGTLETRTLQTPNPPPAADLLAQCKVAVLIQTQRTVGNGVVLFLEGTHQPLKVDGPEAINRTQRLFGVYPMVDLLTVEPDSWLPLPKCKVYIG